MSTELMTELLEAEEFDDLGHVVNTRRGISLLPIHRRHLIATDDFGNVDLTEIAVETAFADFLAQGLWAGRAALLLCSITSPWATNPCSCGYYGDPRRECRCGTKDMQKYGQRISGPLLDRIDLLSYHAINR